MLPRFSVLVLVFLSSFVYAFSHAANRARRAWYAQGGSDQKAAGQGLEIESAIEPAGKSAEILQGVLAKAKTMVIASQTGLEIAQHRQTT